MIRRRKYLDSIMRIFDLGKSVFLVGGRQVGKTNLMKSIEYFNLYPNKKIFYINFDEIVLRGFLEFSNLNEFIDYINTYFKINIEDFDIIFFDEIVRIKNFNLIIKALIDKYKGQKKFICTSSGNYDFVDSVIEGLAGRIIKINVYPLDINEYFLFKNKNFEFETITEKIFDLIKNDIFEYLTFGGYPEVVLTNTFEGKKLVLKSIVDSVFDRDLKLFVKEEKIVDLNKFISYITRNTGSLFSFEGCAGELGLKLNDVKNFFNMIEKTFLMFKLLPFYKDKKSEYSSKPKIYISDFGIMNFILNKFELKNFLSGKDVEMMVFLNILFNLNIGDKIQYYQKINGTEIDFIYSKNSKLIPIETKVSNKDIIPKIFSGFYTKYNQDINYFIKTTSSILKQRDLENKKIKFLPFWNVINDLF